MSEIPRPKRRMDSLQDLIEEAKVRTVCWAICIFAITYFLSHTSKSMWTNIPMSILILSALRYLSYKVELRWKVRPVHRQAYLSHLAKNQFPVTDSCLSTVPTNLRGRTKIDSPNVEAAINDFINKILQDFVVDLWYSSITPDKEAPELIRRIILDALDEISGRLKEINLVDLLTRDMVDLIGNHIDLFRKNQSEIGVDVMGTLSSEERDERLKHHLMASKELHPALISSESEHKVLQCIVGGILSVILRPQEAQCPLVCCISRELLTCLVLQHVMDFASPGYINELIEYIFLASSDNRSGEVGVDRSTPMSSNDNNSSFSVGNSRVGELDSRAIASNQSSELTFSNTEKNLSSDSSEYAKRSTLHEDTLHPPRAADWAKVLEAATKRRSQVLAPENLDNMWAKGRNYKKKTAKLVNHGTLSSKRTSSVPIDNAVLEGNSGKELFSSVNGRITGIEDNYMVHLMHGSSNSNRAIVAANNEPYVIQNSIKEQPFGGHHFDDGREANIKKPATTNTSQLKRSVSTPDMDTSFSVKNSEHTVSKEYYEPNATKDKEVRSGGLVPYSEGSSHVPKIQCRVIGAYFEKIGSKSFAVYSIAVTDAENKTWQVKRRYRNFERLHRHLKDIPNYTLQLPPKRFLSSSTDDYFVHQRCILLDKYLQDLLSIANCAEQHEVWDFLSVSSMNYSFGKSTSVMKTLAVNMDDAMDDIVRQFKGVSGGLRRKAVSSSPSHVTFPPVPVKSSTISWNEEDMSKHSSGHSNVETSRSHSDEEAHDEDHSTREDNGWHSDNELNSKSFPPRIVKRIEVSANFDPQRSQQSDKLNKINLDKYSMSKNAVASDLLEDLVGMPPEWTPPNVSVPLLNLVDKIFQLNRRGWLRRQVFWMSKQILQLMMEDAIDDWILRQIHWLRRDEVIAQGIRWVQDVLWPNGTFFIKLGNSQEPALNTGTSGVRPSAFELQLEAARRASDVKKMILGGAPTTLVSLIGHNQYRRCAKDIYYFLQSTICLKQLAYGMLELLVISVFPELRESVLDIHEKARNQHE